MELKSGWPGVTLLQYQPDLSKIADTHSDRKGSIIKHLFTKPSFIRVSRLENIENIVATLFTFFVSRWVILDQYSHLTPLRSYAMDNASCWHCVCSCMKWTAPKRAEAWVNLQSHWSNQLNCTTESCLSTAQFASVTASLVANPRYLWTLSTPLAWSVSWKLPCQFVPMYTFLNLKDALEVFCNYCKSFLYWRTFLICFNFASTDWILEQNKRE